MLFPLFDNDCELVGWTRPDEHIFSTSMDWLAYIQNGHAWSAKTGNWLESVKGMLCLDQRGNPVAWN